MNNLMLMSKLFMYSRASDYGLMKIDHTGRIVHFAEKPKGSELKAMVHQYIPLFQ